MKTSHERIASALELFLRELPETGGEAVQVVGAVEPALRERLARFCEARGVALDWSAGADEVLPQAGGRAAVVLLGVAARQTPARWQPLLRREGVLLLEAVGGGTLRQWRAALGQGGFYRIHDRGEASHVPSAENPALILARSAGPRERSAEPAAPARAMAAVDSGAFREKLAAELGAVLRLPPSELDPSVPFTEFGLDSVLGVIFINRVNAALGVQLKPTALFDHASLEALSAHLKAHAPVLPVPSPAPAPVVVETKPETTAAVPDDVAIIGIAGRFPGADDVEAFWNDLAQGVDRITSPPEGRWSGGTSRRGGFMREVEAFDPLFFQISGREAEATDPQQRLFLESCYHALEDAGYAGALLGEAGRCGVFAGVEPGDYLHLLLKREREEKSPVFQGNAESILAARIAYFLDLKGPALAVNTACSSSLVAIHLACRSLAAGECEMALAGGVRVYASEQAYGALGNMGMLSSEARCKTFDATADGFVPGEAVGVVLLKPLAAALRDGDPIRGVVKGSAINQDGRTNGITAPSSRAQTEVEREVYRRFRLDPQSFQYVEAHGTGTRLGDPIEIQALTEAFRPYGVPPQSCAIGSVKTNIGHTMAAAGVVSVIKVLMAMKHRQIPPSLHLQTLNPMLEIEASPFRVQTSLAAWEAPAGGRRRAAVSSFGFSGTNSHLVLEEAPARSGGRGLARPARLFLLSARTREALRQRAGQLAQWLEGEGCGSDLADLAWTLHLGRAHFEERCAILAASPEELATRLKSVAEGEKAEGGVWMSGEGGADVELHREMLASLEADLRTALEPALYRRKLGALGSLYALGHLPEVSALFHGETPQRIALPGYPFARERYWIALDEQPWHPMFPKPESAPGAEPELRARWSGGETFLDQHRVNGVPTLPGVAFLEMAAALAARDEGAMGRMLRLEKVDWLRPLRVEGEAGITISRMGEHFEVSDGGTVFARGNVGSAPQTPAGRREIAAILERCRGGQRHEAKTFYRHCGEAGLRLGEAFQSWEEGWFLDDEAVVSFPAGKAERGWFLHPGVMDGGVQAGALLASGGGALPVPFHLGTAEFVLRRDQLRTARYAHVRRLPERLFEVAWLDEQGNELVVLHGMLMREIRPAQQPAPVSKPRPEPEPEPVAASGTAEGEALLSWLIDAFAEQVKLPRERIAPGKALEHYGLDSIMVVDFTTRLERDFGPLSRTLLFEHQTLGELADHLLAHHELPAALRRETPIAVAEKSVEAASSPALPATPLPVDEPIAIIGISGRFPKADDLDAFWELLREGRDAIEEIPASRWDYRLFYDPRPGQPGKTRNRWGGFLEGMERFDPMFFSITPREAMALDPQERLFLETAWRTVEDAGYRRSALAGRAVGVYVGVMYGEYQLYGAGNPEAGEVYPLNSSYASIANRVSYFFNWHGPSLALDTMCSSSLMAIHLACQSLRLGECEAALAGGVNTTLHPHKDILLAPGGFAASDGRCHSFGEGGDGYVPGEGVGAVLLKPLSRALADGDVIHGVIRGSAVNHGGKTNGYTVPNPKAQTALVRQALERAGVERVEVIEAHGTGTPLGDPIEIAALRRAFEGRSGGECWIGSVKSNIGHLEAAAGMAGLSKLILQMRHNAVAPSLHSEKLNPHIPFEETPFRVPQRLESWLRGSQPRRAGLSSFGAGGANAHLILEEPPLCEPALEESGGPVLLLLSARKADRLKARAEQLLAYLEAMERSEHPGVTLAAVARTLQAGREAMAERLTWIAADVKEAVAVLRDWIAGNPAAKMFRARAEETAAPTPAVDASPEELAAFWVKGGEVDWERRFPAGWRRVSLPSYPFFGERYWAPDEMTRPVAPVPVQPAGEALCLKPVWREAALRDNTPPLEGTLLLIGSEAASEWERLSPNLRVVSAPGGQDAEALGRLVKEHAPRWVVLYAGEGLREMVELSQALMRRGGKVDGLLVHHGELLHRAAGALARTISYEAPALCWRVLEAGEASAAELYRELLTPGDPREVRLRSGKREALALEELTPARPGAGVLRKGGVYLITGGLGGVGQHLAQHLAAHYRAVLVLVGRSPLKNEVALEAIRNAGAAEVVYLQGDIVMDAGTLVAEAQRRFGRLHGIFHAAGVLRDGLFVRKPMSDFETVLAPKVAGTLALDEATRNLPLDFMALFSSTAGIFGNAGQADYALANAFLDAFAAEREVQRRAGQRQGRTISLNWPYWAEGGMTLAENEVAAKLGKIGMTPLPTAAGLRLLEEILAGGEPQVIPLWGDADRLRATFLSPQQEEPPRQEAASPGAVEEGTLAYLTRTLAEVTGMPPDALDPRERFEAFGVDSIVVNDFNLRLEQSFGEVPKTLLYEYPTLRELAAHLTKAYPELCRPSGAAEPEIATPATAPAQVQAVVSPPENEGIAIIGLAGRYPRSPDLAAFWNLLRNGGDAVTEVPAERWDVEAFYDPDPEKAAQGRIYARWGAFLDGVDRFDPLFFHIAPLEAELIDPQERLMLEIAWQALEDAGYTRHDLQRWREGEGQANVGVFIGATTWSYDAVANDEPHRLPTSLPWSLANRLSYFFNFNGPSMPVDTACSSSLTAIHLACEAIRSGQCRQALAGGVNLYLHPSKYRNLCMARMLATDGKCRSFGKGGSGFVPGEGVGAVLLKPLHQAVADGDTIYGVIRGSAVNHGGFTNGYTVPNPAAQAQLLAQAWKNGGVDPESISYLEAHGTGTALGDPIEAEGMARALGSRSAPCRIGSVKSNIGHLEAAAGIAGLTKVLLQMRHGEIAPTLHADEPNPAIGWERLPLALARQLTPWAEASRRAGISSFGAGGANAHIVVESWETPARQPEAERPSLILLSARRRETLGVIAGRLAEHLEARPEVTLSEVARTLQIGREALETRVAWIAQSREQLCGQLRELSRGLEGVAFLLGEAKVRCFPPSGNGVRPAAQTLAEWQRLAGLWLQGEEIDWAAGWEAAGGGAARTVPLPGYPFDGKRCWVPRQEEVRFEVSHPVLRDHRVHGTAILPGAALLDLSFQHGAKRLRQIVWQRPAKAEAGGAVALRWKQEETGNGFAFEWRDAVSGEVLTQGRADGQAFRAERIDLKERRAACRASLSPEELYGRFAAAGMEYGSEFQVVRRLEMGEGCFYSELEASGVEWAGIHPALMDGAFQCLAAIGAGGEGLAIPFTLEHFSASASRLNGRCVAAGRREGNRFDLWLTDETGEVLVRMEGLTLRPYGGAPAPKPETARPAPEPVKPTPPRTGAPAGALEAVKEAIARVLRLETGELDAEAELGDYGFDSITFTTLANDLNAAHGLELTPAVFFEYPTLKALADYLGEAHFQESPAPVPVVPVAPAAVDEEPPAVRQEHTREPIAIVAMSGVFPGSPDLESFWQHLEAGDDLITRADGVRLQTWRAAGGDGTPPWGGFVEEIDQFDAALFELSPREAMLMDPQQRLFLQAMWRAMEDGGYRRSDLAGSRTGVFVGVAANDYSHLLAVAGVPVEAYSATGNAHSVLANRASYFFDLRGPSEALDTACSSSLVAIHRAAEAIASGSCDMAFAGGVNVLLGMGAFEAFTKAGMLCEDGRCKTFDAAANGYVRGEGVGVLLLKPLSRARRDGDRIHGLLLGSAENHGGRVQSLTVPNPNAQAAVLREAWEKAGVDPRTLSLIEAHGTGTSLGDPIEINGLRKAWEHWSAGTPVQNPQCAVGSVKTQIGHLETAAGVAGVIKTLLAMRHGKIPGNVHLKTLNPYIPVEEMPFFFPQATQEWRRLNEAGGRPLPRRAGVSSFGFGGSNAHLVLEEAPEETATPAVAEGPQLLILSARDRDRLKALAAQWSEWEGDASLHEIAVTLRCAREPMEERLAIIADDRQAFQTTLRHYLAGEKGDYLAGSPQEQRAALSLLREVHGEDDAALVQPLLAARDWKRLAKLWVAGVRIDWPRETVRRISAPGYPFAPTRFWVPMSQREPAAPTGHPWLGQPQRTKTGGSFSLRLTEQTPVLVEHRVAGRGVFPAAAILELAAAGCARLTQGEGAVELSEVVFLRPVEAGEWQLALNAGEGDDRSRWTLGQVGTAHASGVARCGVFLPAPICDLAALRERCGHRVEPGALYAGFAERGLDYGPGFRVIEALAVGEDEAVATLRLPTGGEGLAMPPALLDGAFQCLGALDPRQEAALPFAVERLTCFQPLPETCVAVIRRERPSQGELQRYDITLTTQAGEGLVQIHGYATRRAVRPTGTPQPAEPSQPSKASLLPKLVSAFAGLSGMEEAAIRTDETLERYGFDSIMAVEFSEALERDFGPLPKTLLFEYPTLEALAGWLEAERPDACAALAPPAPATVAAPPAVVAPALREPREPDAPDDGAIAIIGLAGRYPQAETLEAFWENLVAGKDCIETIPGERWDYRLYFDAEGKRPGTSTNRWGGFLRQVDHFDPLFFHISPREAGIIDPQERLFLQTVWNTVENAGYAPRSLKGKAVGVYVGVMYGQYQLFGVEESARQGHVVPLSSSFASIANRVSYHFDWRGPSLALDAMCSSSLLSIHLACESLRRNESELAVAGGVNLILHPHKEVGLSQGGFLNREGRCRSFGATQGRGYIPGEGVGAVLLKPLHAALRDGDAIHGIIRASSVNHGGHTSGYGFPNPGAQSELVRNALERAGVDPASINYVEAAATGSSLGDPLEIAALSRVFGPQACAIGSVKSNIGHLESASGIAGLTKVLLQMRHRTLVPSLHAEVLNPEVEWAKTPFVVQREAAPWSPVSDGTGKALPLRAGINAFGAGGSNAHLVVEEPPARPAREEGGPGEPTLVVISARDEGGLRRRVEALAVALREGGNLRDLAATLAYGREPMAERLAWVVRSVDEWRDWLSQWLRHGGSGYRGRVMQGAHEVPAASGDVHEIARAWVNGSGGLPPEPATWRRVALPGYPFVGERCWFAEAGETAAIPPPEVSGEVVPQLREMLSEVLKLAPERIGSDGRLVEYGLDSMTTLALLEGVRRRWGLALQPSALFEHPTLAALGALIQSRLPERPARVAVNGAGDPPPRQVALAPSDYLFTGSDRFAMSLFLLPGGRLDGVHLERTLEEVSASFFPIRSRLAPHGRNGWLLREHPAGVDFGEIAMGPAVRRPREGDRASFEPFAEAFGPLEDGGRLARFRAYQLEGETVLGVTLSHVAADGYSLYYLLSAWAGACRGESFLEPRHDRQRLTRLASRYLARQGSRRGRDDRWRFPRLARHAEPLTDRVRTFHFHAEEKLAAAMAECRGSLRDQLSENSVLTALVWKAYTEELALAGDEEVSLCIPMDYRRLSPVLSPAFFGNGAVPALLRARRDEVLGLSLARLAGRISTALQECDEGRLAAYQAAMLELRRGPGGREGLARRALVDPAQGLIVTNVARFPLPSLDFGTGTETEVLAPVHYAGTAIISDARRGNGEVKVELALPARKETSRKAL